MTDTFSAPRLSRRSFISGAGGLALHHWAGGGARALGESKCIAYVGTYTGAVGNLANGEGIYAFACDAATGELTSRRLAATTPSPSWIVVHPSRRYLYAVNEVADCHGNSGSVSSFAIDHATGNLTALNTVSSQGSGPAYISMDKAGRYCLVANYGGGSIAVLPVLQNGAVGAAVDVRRDAGLVGGTRAADAPAGSFAISGHDAPHMHMILPDPQNRYILAADLGQDRIYSWRFDGETGKLSQTVQYATLPSGDGPRHFVFHPNGRWLYSIQEESSTVVLFDYEADTGSLRARQTVSALPSRFAGTSFASEILVHPNGEFLYAANRLQNTIATFSVAADGRLERTGETPAMGDYPSQCRIDPSGRFLYVCNRRSDNITSFRIHQKTGLPTFTGQYTPVGSPGSITFLT